MTPKRGGFAVMAASLTLSSLGLAACATTPFGAPVKPAPEPHAKGYLSPAAVAALAAAVPAPSDIGSPARLADQALSDKYRVLENSDRWLLATAHAEMRPALARQHFDCALGVRFAAAPTPRLTVLFEKLLHDADSVAEIVKARSARPRPVGVDPQRAACQRVSEAGRASASYPSGTAAVGTAYAEALAAAAPEQAAALRAMGHEISISRAVCAMHYPADVAAGEAVGRAVFAEAAATPAFQADLTAARAELVQLRATGLTNPGCASERAALATPLF